MPPTDDGGAFENFHLPALRFGITRVHAEKLAGKKRSFVSAGSGADFEDHVFFVVGILGHEQQFQFALHGFAAGFELALFVVRHLLHLGVVRFGE